MAAAKELDRRQAVKRIMATLEKLPSDEDRQAVIGVTISLHHVPQSVRGEADGSVPHVSRRA